MTLRTRLGRRAPLGIWLILAALTIALLVCAALTGLLWQKDSQLQALRAEVQRLTTDRQALAAKLASLESHATDLEGRILTLEASDPGRRLAALQEAVEAITDTQDLDAVRAEMALLHEQVSGFQRLLDGLDSRVGTLEGQGATSANLPAVMRLPVPAQRQSHNLSCESSAASMAARYHGVDLSEADVLAALPLNENPYLGFRGSLDGPTGGIEDYGVYAGPIAAILDNRGLRATLLSGGVEDVRAAVARGNPVVVWITYNCLESMPVTRTVGGQTVTLVPNQHAVVVTGYDTQGFWANDPWDGQEDYYTIADLARAMSYFSNMAIEVAAP